jgi:phosphomannomutase
MVIDPSIFKEYDIRGVYPDTINYELAVLIGRAFADLVIEQGPIAVGRDMRLSSPEIAKGLIEGITKQGRDVIDVGLITTDMSYFAAGKFPFAGGIMITASHNPKEYNGLKLCLAKAAPVSGDGGIYQMRDNILNNKFKQAEKVGQVSEKNILADWINHALSFIDEKAIKPLKIVVDAGNGMASILFPELKKRLPLEIIPLYFELDGSFPNHPAAPIVPENLKDAQKKVLDEKADLGLVFDGDGDRAVLIDETGRVVSGTIMTAMIAEYFLKKIKGATILYNAICGWIVPEVISSLKGKGIRVPVGHSLIKENMRKYDALFAGEHSGHYYFKENYYADSALITILITLQIISQENKKVSEIIKKFDKYPSSGEINFEISDKEKVINEVEKIYGQKAKSTDKIDGLTVWFDDWWFNLRPSNTEPLLRLNIEAKNQELLDLRKKEIIDFLKGYGSLATGR